MDSIVQFDTSVCWLCDRFATHGQPLDKHHCFGGAYRKKSEALGLFVYLHHDECHIFGKDSAHQSAETALKIKQAAQLAAMQQYGWSIDDFIREFGKNYL